MEVELILLIAAFVVFVVVAWMQRSLLAVCLALWVLAELCPKAF